MKTLKQAYIPRASVCDPSRLETDLDLNGQVEGRIEPDTFFVENHVTEGMRMLLTEGFGRLEDKSTQGHGEHRSGVYQEFARGFGVRDHRFMLHTGKGNQTWLRTPHSHLGLTEQLAHSGSGA